MNIINAIKDRRSVRSFDGASLTESTKKILTDFAESLTSPFGGHFTIRLKKFDIKGEYRPSTYGTIKEASDFFLIGMGSDEASALSVGFCFEQVVLKAWQLGLGTCWIAGTFKSTNFDKDETWPDGEILKIICPVGIPTQKRMFEKIARLALGSSKRKPFDELFFEGDFNHPLSADSSYHEALEMLRLAPSSTNSQPWRVLVKDDKVHFFYIPKNAISPVDLGIGISHFYETERFNGREGEFYKENEAPAGNANWCYAVSYKRN
ncbi:MAG: nitroreductase family protein [Muribaculaceae bacterium]|nr:nitroreductase family protein [Muribaculaceae bacterium]